MSTTDNSGGGPRRTSVFDIRVVIASLLGLFGVIILFMGFFGTSDADLERADGTNLNLWTGAGLLVAAAVFVVWGQLRPVRPDEEAPEEDTGDQHTGDDTEQR
ncbi:hypothetical protein CLV30_101247 [Haloactinopolyspora alba]|uniref:Uncharacterized protein n=1 Tax=Haloactinopolyspora alba TaxID=648780 RepID=A0A2P8EFN2_9ACTN|nr:hypothetical protein [Haloactinopolyspora alba]PSL08276.1 hypothetical protein CLV30_101247 [Haloactinopolyspora alba]